MEAQQSQATDRASLVVVGEWLPVRGDSRRANRIVRWQAHAGAFGLALIYCASVGWLAGSAVAVPLILLGIIVFAGALLAYALMFESSLSKRGILARTLNQQGYEAECPVQVFYEIEGWESGRDSGFLSLQDGSLVFEGVTSRFRLPYSSIESVHSSSNDTSRESAFRVDLPERQTVRITSRAGTCLKLFAIWPSAEEQDSEPIFPPTAPQARSFVYLLERTNEHSKLSVGGSFAVFGCSAALMLAKSQEAIWVMSAFTVCLLVALVVRFFYKMRRIVHEDGQYIARCQSRRVE